MSQDNKSKIAAKAITAALAALMIVVAVPAAHADWRGDGYGYGRGGWDRHADYARRDWHRWHGPRPGYVYAPPVDYYPPPAVVPGLNIGLNFQ